MTLSDSGLYTCQVKSRSGQAVWSASLQVADPNLDPSVTFNSMPYLSQFPASPSKPQMVNATATSITLRWDKPHRIGGSALQGYQVITLLKAEWWVTDFFSFFSWITLAWILPVIGTLCRMSPKRFIQWQIWHLPQPLSLLSELAIIMGFRPLLPFPSLWTQKVEQD